MKGSIVVSRLILTEAQYTFMKICMENICTEFLESKHQEIFISIRQQWTIDGKLSDKQMAVIRKYKYISDIAKRNQFLEQYGTFDTATIEHRQKKRSYFKSGRY